MNTETPIIDWEQGKKIAGNNLNLAEELLSILIKTLPQETATIRNSFDNKINPEFRKHVHKLHGAVCYCGVPRIKKTLDQIETAIKTNAPSIVANLIVTLEDETNALLKFYGQHVSNSFTINSTQG